MDELLQEYDEWKALAESHGRFSFNLLNCLTAAACVKVWFLPSLLSSNMLSIKLLKKLTN
jgi:hypothetical protein